MQDRLSNGLLLASFAAVLAAAVAARAQNCPSPGGCWTPHAGPGCSDVCCCQAVCEVLPYCCEDGADWDAFCADLANSNTLPACTGSPPTPVVAFSDAPYTVTEGGTALITVSFYGCTTGTASVSFGTSNGTATAGSDYTSVSGTLTWTAGDATARTFGVPTLTDGVTEPSETVILTLSAPSGCVIAAPNPATLTILDASLAAPNNLVVASLLTASVEEYRWPTGVSVGPLVPPGSGGLYLPYILRFGPNWQLYVADSGTARVYRYNARTGAPVGTFLSLTGMTKVYSLAWAPNGNVLTGSHYLIGGEQLGACLLEFDGSGQFIRNFQTLDTTATGPVIVAFRPNGNVLASDSEGNRVLEYTYPGAALVRTYTGGLNWPLGVTIGPNGNLFVCSALNDKVVQFNTTTGALVGDFVTAGSGGLDLPGDLTFGSNGNLFVTSSNADSVLEYNGSTGAYVRAFVSSGAGGLNGPMGLVFRSPYPAGDLNCDGTIGFGDINPFVLALSNPAGYAAAFPDCDIMTGDINGDGSVDFGDINPFVALLSGS
jgi:hypothetical protein